MINDDTNWDKAPKGHVDFKPSDFEEIIEAMGDKAPEMLAIPCTGEQLKEIKRLKLNEFETFHFLLKENDINLKLP